MAWGEPSEAAAKLWHNGGQVYHSQGGPSIGHRPVDKCGHILTSTLGGSSWKWNWVSVSLSPPLTAQLQTPLGSQLLELPKCPFPFVILLVHLVNVHYGLTRLQALSSALRIERDTEATQCLSSWDIHSRWEEIDKAYIKPLSYILYEIRISAWEKIW